MAEQAPSVAQAIRDDLIEQELRYRRVDAGVRREVDARLLKLQADLKALALRIDPGGTERPAARSARLGKLEMKSKAMIDAAYRDVEAIMKQASRRVALAEVEHLNTIMRTHLP